MFNFSSSSSLSSGSNLVKVIEQSSKVNKRKEKVEQLQKKYKFLIIKTSCGEFFVFEWCYNRLSDELIDHFLKNINHILMLRGYDHETFLFIHRFIVCNIKVDLNTLCTRLGITRDTGLFLIKQWGYDESICV